jgi:hypothetical protein
MRKIPRLFIQLIFSSQFANLTEGPRLTSREHGGRLDYILRNAL